jgi:hypothetical protein
MPSESQSERDESLKPDKDKVREFAAFIRSMPMPVMSTEDGQAFIDSLDEPLHLVATMCEEWSK